MSVAIPIIVVCDDCLCMCRSGWSDVGDDTERMELCSQLLVCLLEVRIIITGSSARLVSNNYLKFSFSSKFVCLCLLLLPAGTHVQSHSYRRPLAAMAVGVDIMFTCHYVDSLYFESVVQICSVISSPR